MEFKEIVVRVGEISISVFGIDWNPTEPEIINAQRVILYLEKQPVLSSPEDLENTDHCVESILKIKKFLDDELKNADQKSALSKNLRGLISACEKFLNEAPGRQSGPNTFPFEKFYSRLGIMRGVFGMHIALVAAAYGLDVEDELSSILPNQSEYANKKNTATTTRNYI